MGVPVYRRILELFEAEGMNINYMAYNTTTSMFADEAARIAFSQAIDREELVASLYQGYSDVADTILPTFVPGFDDTVKQVEAQLMQRNYEGFLK